MLQTRLVFANYPIASFLATNNYAHRSILEVLLNYAKEAAES